MARNTGPAVLAAAMYVGGAEPDSLIVVLPSDHVIQGDLNGVIQAMQKAALDGLIVTFGIRPTFAETGYGYIMDGGGFDNYPGLHHVERFIEKPELSIAHSLFETGYAYWASGISMFRADKLINEYRLHDPATSAAVRASLNDAEPLSGNRGIALSGKSFVKSISLPTEKAIFERTKDIALAPANIKWDDVGAWNALHSIGHKCENGNVTTGDVILHDTQDSLVRGGDRLIAVVGMTDVVVVDTDDALLVTSKQRAQDVKKIVEKLVSTQRPEVSRHRNQHMEWGTFKSIHAANGVTMNLLTIAPGKQARIPGGSERSHIVTVFKRHRASQVRLNGNADPCWQRGDVFKRGLCTRQQLLGSACGIDRDHLRDPTSRTPGSPYCRARRRHAAGHWSRRLCVERPCAQHFLPLRWRVFCHWHLVRRASAAISQQPKRRCGSALQSSVRCCLLRQSGLAMDY